MSPFDGIVVLLGIAAIAWVNWYFFLAGRATRQAHRRGLKGFPWQLL